MTPESAFEDFAKPIRAATACLDANAHLNVKRVRERHILHSAADVGISMQRSGDRFQLDTLFHVRPIPMEKEPGRWRVTTLQYIHEIIDQHGKRLAAWHWHPENKRSHATFAHLHVAAGAPFSSLHYPTGRVTIEEVVRFAITELGIEPAHGNWEGPLQESEKRHRSYSSW